MFLILALDLKDDSISSVEDAEQQGMLQRPHAYRETCSPNEYAPSSSTYSLYQETHITENEQSDIKQTSTGGIKTPLGTKPRIWSLAEMANKEDKDHKRSYAINSIYHPAYGKIQPFLSSQIQYPIIMKPGDPNTSGNSDHQNALMEHYQRTLSAHQNLQSSTQAYLSLLPNHIEKATTQQMNTNPIHPNMNNLTMTNISSLQSIRSKEDHSSAESKTVHLTVNLHTESSVTDTDFNKRQNNI